MSMQLLLLDEGCWVLRLPFPLNEGGRCVGVDDIDKYCKRLDGSTDTMLALAWRDDCRIYPAAGKFENTGHMSRVLD